MFCRNQPHLRVFMVFQGHHLHQGQEMVQQLMALILNIPHLQPSHFCCIILIFSAFLQEHHIPAGAGSGLLGSLLTRPGAFPGANETPCKSCSQCFPKMWPGGPGSQYHLSSLSLGELKNCSLHL